MLAVVLSLGKHPGRLWLAVQLGVLGCVLLSLVTSCPWSFTPVGLVCVKLWLVAMAQLHFPPLTRATALLAPLALLSLHLLVWLLGTVMFGHQGGQTLQQRTETFSLASLEPLTCWAVLSEGGET